ncbi:cupin domain-containing protein [Amycolatopsis sp. A133]|uniref:cupin domain-containing protein n=1 Tax=Amycolatopsis sp. A133 TaxID=3064472 RepID=UPI0027FF4CF5|nr:cupin domain-containing protein [Amycolatopsis sp. A133]MDQ7808158.1 cupin domain-containing protein [Amycolatopsis sp. A133]
MMGGMEEQVWQPLRTVEGLPLHGGEGRFRQLERAASGLAYLIHYPAGVASPTHAHDHDSIVYVLSGRLRGAVDGVEAVLEPGDSALHPRGVAHHVEALTDSMWVEFKSPLPQRPPIA